jgi:hypothetical protein
MGRYGIPNEQSTNRDKRGGNGSTGKIMITNCVTANLELLQSSNIAESN